MSLTAEQSNVLAEVQKRMEKGNESYLIICSTDDDDFTFHMVGNKVKLGAVLVHSCTIQPAMVAFLEAVILLAKEK